MYFAVSSHQAMCNDFEVRCVFVTGAGYCLNIFYLKQYFLILYFEEYKHVSLQDAFFHLTLGANVLKCLMLSHAQKEAAVQL